MCIINLLGLLFSMESAIRQVLLLNWSTSPRRRYPLHVPSGRLWKLWSTLWRGLPCVGRCWISSVTGRQRSAFVRLLRLDRGPVRDQGHYLVDIRMTSSRHDSNIFCYPMRMVINKGRNGMDQILEVLLLQLGKSHCKGMDLNNVRSVSLSRSKHWYAIFNS